MHEDSRLIDSQITAAIERAEVPFVEPEPALSVGQSQAIDGRSHLPLAAAIKLQHGRL